MQETMGVKVREKNPGSGVYYVFVNVEGYRKAQRVGSRGEASGLARKIRKEIACGRFQKNRSQEAESITLREYFKEFTRGYLATGVRYRTAQQYRDNFRLHVLPELGDLPLAAIDRKRVKAFVTGLAKKEIIIGKAIAGGAPKKKVLSKASLRIITADLATVLQHAIEDEYIVANPAARLGKFYKDAPTPHDEIFPLTDEDIPKFLNAVLQRSPDYYEFFLCAIHTGLRKGELAALRWGDIDFAGKFLLVRKNISRGRLGRTKTDRIRKVDISDALYDALQALKVRRSNEWATEGKELPAWVFANRVGKPPDIKNTCNRHYFPALEAAGLARRRFHDLRHTFASILISKGESLAYVRTQLGHSSITLTVNTYTHLIPGANRQAVNKIPGADLGGTKVLELQK